MKKSWAVALAVTLTAAVVALALVLNGLWPVSTNATPAQAVEGSLKVTAGQAVLFPSTDGSPEVHIPGDALSGDGVLNVKPVQVSDSRSGWDIGLAEGARLTGQATLIFKDAVEDGSPPPLIVFAEEPGDEPQYAQDIEVSGRDLIVRTTHFSFWEKLNWDWLLEWARGEMDRMYKDTGHGEQPTCEREADARAGDVVVKSDSGGRVQWCLDKNPDGSSVLKVNNSRGYAVAAERSPGLTITSRNEEFSQLLPKLTKYITAPTRKSNTIDIIGPGETIEYKVDPAGTEGAVGVTLEPSGAAYLASALLFGFETVGLVFKKVVGPVSGDAISAAMDAANCVGGFQSMATADVTEGRQAGKYFGDAMATVMACTGDVFRKLAQGKVLDLFAVSVAQALSWLVSGIQTLANSLGALADTVLNLNGYTLTVWYRGQFSTPSSPPSAAAYIPGLPNALSGTWCTRSTPGKCFSAAEIKKASPEARVMEPSPSTQAPGATDYVLCVKMDLSDHCTTASTIYLRYFPAGVTWNCVQTQVVLNDWPACEPDYTSSHDSSQPRLLILPNHQQSPDFIDSPPMYRTQ
ncbi:hypothetical protein [Arthrobacter humicola]